jgi:hypothetical protein
MVEKGPGDEHDREDGHEPDEDHGDDHPETSPPEEAVRSSRVATHPLRSMSDAGSLTTTAS